MLHETAWNNFRKSVCQECSSRVVPQQCLTSVLQECRARDLQELHTRVPQQERLARVSHKGVLPECRARVFHKSVSRKSVSHESVSHESVPQVSYKSVLQECPTRISDKSVLQKCETRVSCKSFVQACAARVLHKSVSPENSNPIGFHLLSHVMSDDNPLLSLISHIRVRGFHTCFRGKVSDLRSVFHVQKS